MLAMFTSINNHQKNPQLNREPPTKLMRTDASQPVVSGCTR